MTHRFLLFSEDKADFVMEIMALPSTSFHELHTLILEECNYKENGNHLFLICNEDWRIKEKIHLHNTDRIEYDEDFNLMHSSFLEDFIEEEGQHMAYIFETDSKKKFLIELVENIFSEKAENAFVSRKKGTPPIQFEEANTAEPSIPTTDTLQAQEEPSGENSYSNDDFNEDEIDMEGFEVTEM